MNNSVPLYQKTDFSDKGDFMLLLGESCNMNCIHCAQLPVREKIDSGKKINPKVWEMMDNYINYALKMRGGEMPFIYIFMAVKPLFIGI